MAGAEGPAGRQSELEPVVSLVDVLEEDEELENEACAVLGGSDSEKCSYSQVGARPGPGSPGSRRTPVGRPDSPSSRWRYGAADGRRRSLPRPSCPETSASRALFLSL